MKKNSNVQITDTDNNVIALSKLITHDESNFEVKIVDFAGSQNASLFGGLLNKNSELAKNKNALVVGRTFLLKSIDAVSGVEIFKGTLSQKNGKVLHLSNCTRISEVQRRNDIKIKFEHNVVIYPIIKSKIGRSTSVSRLVDKATEVSIVNLSAGGIGFISEEALDAYSLYELDFHWSNPPVILPFEIIREDKKDNATYSYGCKFVNVSFANEEIVRQFVFKYIIESRANNKDK